MSEWKKNNLSNGHQAHFPYTFTLPILYGFLLFPSVYDAPKNSLNNYFPFSKAEAENSSIGYKKSLLSWSAHVSMTKILPFLREHMGRLHKLWKAKVKTHHSSEEFFMADVLWWERDRKCETSWNIEDVGNSLNEKINQKKNHQEMFKISYKKL